MSEMTSSGMLLKTTYFSEMFNNFNYSVWMWLLLIQKFHCIQSHQNNEISTLFFLCSLIIFTNRSIRILVSQESELKSLKFPDLEFESAIFLTDFAVLYGISFLRISLRLLITVAVGNIVFKSELSSSLKVSELKNSLN